MKSVQIFLAIIILTAGIVGGFYYFQPVEEVTEEKTTEPVKETKKTKPVKEPKTTKKK